MGLKPWEVCAFFRSLDPFSFSSETLNLICCNPQIARSLLHVLFFIRWASIAVFPASHNCVLVVIIGDCRKSLIPKSTA